MNLDRQVFVMHFSFLSPPPSISFRIKRLGWTAEPSRHFKSIKLWDERAITAPPSTKSHIIASLSSPFCHFLGDDVHEEKGLRSFAQPQTSSDEETFDDGMGWDEMESQAWSTHVLCGMEQPLPRLPLRDPGCGATPHSQTIQ